ncbi:hypothetical protein QFZ58_006701 [Streptomyces sp. B1I3]|nr:hypothetical protein [Streptomyces sp. B1I3]
MITPRHATRLLLTDPEHLWAKYTALLATLTTACPETAELARFVGTFAQLLTPAKGNETRLTEWIAAVRAADLPCPTAWNSTAPQSTPASPCATTTAAPKASTPAPNGS